MINFDFPPTPNDYVHRVGRYATTLFFFFLSLPQILLLSFHYLPHSTARGFESGTALTFVCPTDEGRLKEVEERLRGDSGKKLPQGRSRYKITVISITSL